MGQGLRRASWSGGGGCGGAAGFSFGERPGSNGGSAGRWLLPFPGNGPGIGGVFLGRREQAAAGRRASLSGRSRVRTEALRGGGCCRSPETVREQAVCFLVGGNRLRRTAGFSFGERPARAEVSAGQWLLPFLGNGPGTGGVFLGRRGRAAAGRRASFSGRGGFGHVSRRHRYSLLSPAACVSASRRLPPRCLSSSHHPLLPAPPPLLTRRLCPRRLCPRRLLPPPPLLVTPVAVCLPAACRFSPPVITRRLPPATSAAVCVPASACRPAASHQPHPLPAISAAMRRPGGQMGCGGTPRGRSGRDASPARSSAK